MRRFRLHMGDLYTVPFSIMFLGFSVFWEASVIWGGAGPLFVLWGIPFIAIGLYTLVGRFFYVRYLNRRTVYAITDRRVMSVVRGRAGETVLAFNIDRISGVYVRPGPKRTRHRLVRRPRDMVGRRWGLWPVRRPRAARPRI